MSLHHSSPAHTELLPGRVAVAVNGSPASLRATQVAALEARRRDTQLQIVHIVPSYLSAAALPAVPEIDFAETGADVLDRAVQVARTMAEELDIITTRGSGSRVHEVLSATHDASLLVIGAHEHSLGIGAWAGSVVTGLAARSQCPVLVTPAAVNAAGPTHGRVVAGLKNPAASAALLERAFAVADELGDRLLLVHGWRLPSAYDRYAVDRATWQEWCDDQVRAIQDLIPDLRLAHPEVAVDIEVQHAAGAKALLDASFTADRLLVARPAHGSYLHHLGSTARAVLGAAACPVEVVPPGRGRRLVSAGASEGGARERD